MNDRILDVVILAAARTPMGKRKGGLSLLRPDELSALALREVVSRAKIDPELVEDVIWGCGQQLGEQGHNVARISIIESGLPVSIPGTTVHRICGSSQTAIHMAAYAIASGEMDVVIAGGVESMSRIGIDMDLPDEWSPWLTERFSLAPRPHQGHAGDLIADQYGFSREELDGFACESHKRAARATLEGRFGREIFPVEAPTADGSTQIVAKDEGIRYDVSLEKMATLKPAFRPDGKITAGNASQMTDGAAALVLTSRRKAEELGLKPLARLVATTTVGVHPVSEYLAGPMPATRKVLARAGLHLNDMDVIEVNEAFASVPLAWQREFQADPCKLNPNGGAIALGHPLGCTGARLMTTMIHELMRTGGRYGLQVACIGFGQATASIVEVLRD